MNTTTTTTTTHLISPPDVRSYNIVLEAASKDLSFCNRLWDWMWEESSSSSLSSYDASSVRPDLVTLRTFMKAWVKSGHPDAPEHCEDLVEEWMIQQQQQQNQNQQNTSSDASMIPATRGIRKSLIHVWALQDPVQAEAYLKDMIVQRQQEQQQQGGDGVNTTTYYYYDNDIEELPDTIAWNRVISAYAISHGRPDDAARLLEEFWRFSKSLDENENNEYGFEYGGGERQSQKNHHGIRPDLFSYNSVLEGWARVGNAEMANQTMRRLQRATLISPNIVSYTSAMKANMAVNDLRAIEELAKECLQAADDEEAKAVEEEEEDSFSSFQSYDMTRDNDEFSDSSAMIMSQQRQQQQQQQQRHLVLDTAFFNTWLSAYSQTTEGNSSSAGMVDRALNILKEMKRRNVAADTATYLSLFRCFLAADEPRRAQEWLLSEEAKHMEEASIVSFVSRLVTWNSSHGIDSMALLQGLYEQDYLTDIKSWDRLLSQLLANQGKAVLEWLKSPTTKSYSLVLRALAKDPNSNNNGKEAESLFRQWQNNRRQQQHQLEEGNNNDKGYNDGDDDDDDVSEDALLADMYTSVIIGWSKSGNLERTLSWYEEWASAKHASTAALPPPNRTVQTAVLSAYARAQDAQGAEDFLKRLVKDYNDRRKGGRQQQHHQQQTMDGRPDVVMFNIVLNAWAKGNNAKRAERLLNAMPERNTISYNTVIHAYVRKGKMKRAEELANHLVESFRNGKNNGRPDLATFRSILSGYVRSTDPKAAERASRVIRWMKELHHEGILQSPPDSKCYELQHKAGGGSKTAKTTR